jgi:HEAT repeat protein
VGQVYHKEWADGDVRRAAKVVETQSPMNFGDSGGPLVNGRGELIAVTQGGDFTVLAFDRAGRLRALNARLISWFIHVDEVRAFLGDRDYTWVEGEAAPGPVWEMAKLQQALRGPDVQAARAAADYLAQLGPDAGPAVDDLIVALGHLDPTVRRLAAQALGQIGEPAGRAAPHLADLLDDEPTRLAALRALAQMGAAAAAEIPRVTRLLDSRHRVVRAAALQMLVSLGPRARAAVPDLVGLLTTGDAEVKALAVEALGAIGPEAAAAASVPLAKVLSQAQGNAPLRQDALAALCRLGPGAQAALPAVQAALRDPDQEVRGLAIAVLGVLGPDQNAEQTTVAIKQALGPSPALMILFQALDTWAAFGPQARFAVPYLLELAQGPEDLLLRQLTELTQPPFHRPHSLFEEDSPLRQLAEQTLRRTGDVVQEADLPLFFAAFANPDRAVHTRAYAGWALQKYATPRSDLPVGTLTRLLREPSSEVRGWAAQVLGKLGPRARRTVPDLVRLLAEEGNGEAFVRLGVVIALKSLGAANPDLTVPALRQALADPDRQVRLQAARAVAELGPVAAAAAGELGMALGATDPALRRAGLTPGGADPALRRACLVALSRLGAKAAPAVGPLTDAAHDQDLAVRLLAIDTLGAIGPKAEGAVPVLLAGFRDHERFGARPYKGLFEATANALAKIGKPARDAIQRMDVINKSKDLWEVTGVVSAVARSDLGREVALAYLRSLEAGKMLQNMVRAARTDPDAQEALVLVRAALAHLKRQAERERPR